MNLLLPILLSLAPAWADPTEDSIASETRAQGPVRKFDIELSLRTRNMSLPRGLLDIWFFDNPSRDPRAVGWPLPDESRPHVNGQSYGVEMAFLGDQGGALVYFDYVDSFMGTGYFDDVEDNPPNHLNGDYLRPAPNLGLVAFGANYTFDVPLIKAEKTKGAFAWKFAIGGGLGLGLLTGQIDRWVESDGGEPAFELYHRGDPPNGEKSIPRVFPMVDVNAGMKFIFAERVVLRLEGGLHTLLYWGGSVGIVF